LLIHFAEVEASLGRTEVSFLDAAYFCLTGSVQSACEFFKVLMFFGFAVSHSLLQDALLLEPEDDVTAFKFAIFLDESLRVDEAEAFYIKSIRLLDGL
jgi:hypothetical protein